MLNLPFIISQENSEEEAKVTKAYQCLDNKINNSCSQLTLEQQIFSMLAIGKCSSELKASSKNNECWPNSSCRIKTTAQAILALSNMETDTSKAEQWLLSQNKTASDLEWYLQIEALNSTKCDISYGSSIYSINIGEDKKIDSAAGSCLTLAEGNYWLKISPACYDSEFKISCDRDFLTNLLFKKKDLSTVHVLDETNFGAAGETTEEKINSLCFKQGNTCDYEGSLWAAFVLNSLEHDVSSFMPYLITMKGENEKYLPEAFLAFLGGEDYKTQLLAKQKMGEYWFESSDKFYDTALALYPLYHDEFSQKTKAMEWLLKSQDREGCWQGNIKDTAFILYSVWPRERNEPPVCEGSDCITKADCELSGFFCMSRINCGGENDGEILELYDCNRPGYVCCSEDIKQENCSEKMGEICNLSESCTGTSVPALDIKNNEICCVDGACVKSEESECKIMDGVCKFSCSSDETERNYGCGLFSEVCCIKSTTNKTSKETCESINGTCKSTCSSDERKTKSYTCTDSDEVCCTEKGGLNYLIILVLGILILLVAIGIIFRNKLRIYFSGLGGSNSKKSSPSDFPPYNFNSGMRRPSGRIFPPSETNIPRHISRKNPEELDDVLKKLKEMGK